MPNKSESEAGAKRARTAAKNARGDLADYKKKVREKMASVRAQKVPNALINGAVAATTGIATGAVQGLIPDEITVMKNKVPLGLIRDGGGVLLGTVVAGGSAMMGSEIGIAAGGGVATVCAAGIARMLTTWGRESATTWWEKRGNGAGTGNGNGETAEDRLAA